MSSFVISVKQTNFCPPNQLCGATNHKSDINGLIIYYICNNNNKNYIEKYIFIFKNNIRMCILTCVEVVRKYVII